MTHYIFEPQTFRILTPLMAGIVSVVNAQVTFVS